MATELSRADKDAEIRVEDNHKGDLVETKDEHLRDMVLGAAEAQKEGRSPWKVLLENKKVLLLILAVQSNAIIVGVEFSMPGNLLGIPAFLKLFGVESGDSYAIQAKILTIWSALFATFQVIGQFVGGWQSDYFGRRICLYTVIFWTYIGVMLEVISSDWKMWLGSKIVIGFATGIMQSVVPTYVAEVAPRELRAIYLSFFNMCMNIGGLFATLVSYGTQTAYGSNIDDLRAFRIPLYVALALPTISLLAELCILVESPWWLLMRGRKEQARKNLDYIYSWQDNYDSEAMMAALEYTLEKEAEENELAKQSSYLDCFKGVDLRRTFCAVFPPITQNLTGQNLAGTYATYFFQIAGSKTPLVNSVITTVVGLGANFATFFLIENKRVGRWGLLFSGLIVMTISMLAIALIDVIGHSVYNYAAGVMLTLFVSLFIAASTIGPGVAGWAYTGESGSSRLRAKTATLGTVGNAIVGLIMTSVLPYMLDSPSAGGAGWGARTGFMFFILGVACCVGVYFLVPEYAGRSYAQLDELFARKIPARKFKSTETTGEYGRDVIA
ncbi:hypothetical protein JCM24511_03447 [Saitozyma sp. JCM 24511]|nr:hypothetical protein JCM24511_03447 [Saitozyma sp. JCM 24511]